MEKIVMEETREKERNSRCERARKKRVSPADAFLFCFDPDKKENDCDR